MPKLAYPQSSQWTDGFAVRLAGGSATPMGPERLRPPVDLVCPLDFRYGRKEMKALWTEEARLRYLLQVEAALAHAHAATGTIPKAAAQRLQKVADSDKVTPDRVKEIEAEIKHDLMAVVKAMTEAAGAEDGKFIHLGATSYDIIDTANSLQFRDAIALLRDGLRRLRDAC